MLSSNARRLLAGAAAVAVLALAVRLAVVVELSGNPFFTHRLIDEADYHMLAQLFAKGTWPGDEALFRPPLYPMFLGTVYRLFGEDIVDVKLVQVFLGALVAPLTVLVGWHVLRSARAAIAAGAVVALLAPLVYYDTQLLAASLDGLLVTLAVALVLRADARPSIAGFACAGLAVGLAATNRGSAVLLALVVIVWIARGAGEHRKERLRRASVFALACVAPLLPLAWHNAACDDRPERAYALEAPATTAGRASASETVKRLVTGQVAPLGWADGINFHLGNVPALVEVNRNDHVEHFDRYRELVVEPWRHGKTRASEHAAYLRQATWASIRREPGAWLALLVRKVVETVNGYEVPRGTTPYADRASSSVLAALLWTKPLLFPSGLLLPLAVVGAFVLRGERRWSLVGLLFATQLAFVAAFFVTSRYRVPALPLAAVLVVGLVRELARRDRRWRLGVAAASGCLLLLANLRLPSAPAPERSSAEHYLLANQLVAEKKRDAAIEHYRAAMELEPRHGRAANNIGRLLQDEGKVTEAVALYRASIAADDRNARAHNNLGTALLVQRDPGAAEASFREALRREPEYTTARVNLALALMEQRRFADATSELEIARRERPKDADITRLLVEVARRNGEHQRALSSGPPLTP